MKPVIDYILAKNFIFSFLLLIVSISLFNPVFSIAYFSLSFVAIIVYELYLNRLKKIPGEIADHIIKRVDDENNNDESKKEIKNDEKIINAILLTVKDNGFTNVEKVPDEFFQ